ncbi:hypothetical protein ACE15Y_03560 [Bifidobacterium bifidum]|uniref:hypothetical protein n=1 Tax=Bifidobacterium bifidum TaxID=1681 RepID=UPI003D00D7ED
MAATNVHFSFKNAQGRPKTGTLHVAPVRRHISGSTVVVLGGFDVALGSDGTATVQLEPTDNTFAWLVREFPDDTDSAFERVVQVPASSSTVEYTSLVDVDKDALTPALNTGAALTYLLASSLQEAQAMSAANPGQMVFYPEGQAKTVASQILEDLTGARAVVEAQSAVAAQAANAAQAASVQAADAVQAVSEQTAQVSANAAAVQSVADSISESKTVVESHASEALTAIDEAVKQVRDKASDVSGEDRTDTMPTDSTDSASSQEV